MKEEELKIRALQDEKRDLLNSFAELGKFSGKKRREKEERLNEINEEIERIRNDINNV